MRKLLNWLRRSLDHDMSLGYAKQLLWLSALFVLLFLIILLTLFVIGFVDKAFDMGDVNLPGTAFLLLTDPGNLSGVLPTNQSWIIGIIYAFITIAGAIVFGGLLISLLSNSVQRRIENIQSGNVYYDLKDHIVIIGYDTIVPYLVRQVREKWPDRDVLLLTKKSPVEVREALNTVINGIAEDKHLIIYSGTRSSETDLQKLLPKEAHEIFIIGNRQSDDHDALNIDCLSKLLNIIQPEPEKNEQQEATKEEQEATKEEQEAVKEQKQEEFLMAMPVVNILLENPATQTMLQSTNLADHWQKYLRVIPFSFYETWTRQVLCVQTDDVRQYPRLQVDRKSDEQLNVVIFGMSKMGITMAVEAAHALHFPRKKDGSVCKTIITFVSLDAYEEMTLFRARYRQIFEIQSSRYIDLTGKGKPVVEEMPPTYLYRVRVRSRQCFLGGCPSVPER